MFEKELAYFVAHQDELVAQHRGRVLIIRGNEVIDDFDTTLDAYLYAKKNLEPGTYMIQPCQPGPGAYTVTISSTEALAS